MLTVLLANPLLANSTPFSAKINYLQIQRPQVCLIGQRDGVALVPCGHARFCATCVDTLVIMGTGCPICRADIQMVMRVYNCQH